MNANALGFSNSKEERVQHDDENVLQWINPQDLRSFGLIPELIGRFPVLTYLDPLDPLALRRILTEPKNALIKQYAKLFEMEGIQLNIDKKVLGLYGREGCGIQAWSSWIACHM